MAIFKKTTLPAKRQIKKEKKTEVKPTTAVFLSPKNAFVIKYPWITEKSHDMSIQGKYVFLVDKHANKSEVKKAVEKFYKVNAVAVNIINARKKSSHFGAKITPGARYKKAVVTLKKGQKIDVMPT